MKIALEGPINKMTDSACIQWRIEVIERLKHAYTFHNPMDLDCRGREKEMREELVAFDEEGISSSNIVLIYAELGPGWGTGCALQMGHDLKKIVISVCSSPSPSPWLLDRSTLIVENLEGAIQLLEIYSKQSVHLHEAVHEIFNRGFGSMSKNSLHKIDLKP